jgi:phosphoglycerate dehydrogenase-like enzyme
VKGSAAVAVTSRSFSAHRQLREALLEKYEHVTFNESGTSLQGEALIAFLRGHQKAIIALERIDDAVLAAVPELKVISKYGVGLDTVDLSAMERYGVQLGWTGGTNRRSVAELTMAHALCLFHRLPEATREIQAGRWVQVRGRQLTEKTVGLVGCGHVGREVARLMAALRCRVLVHDIRDVRAFASEHGVEQVSLDTLLNESDIVSLHLPLDASTRLLLDRARLRSMKRGAFIINTARGGLVDESEVYDLLVKGHLGGAAFDVLETEPAIDQNLASLSNVIITPHIGGSTEEAVWQMGLAAIAGLDNGGVVDCAKLHALVAPGLIQ